MDWRMLDWYSKGMIMHKAPEQAMAGLSDIQAVVFDFDGTLVHTDIDFAAMRQGIVEHLHQWDLWEAGVEEGRYVLEIIAWAEEQLQDDPSRQQQYRQEAKKILHEVELPHCQRAEPFPGVPEALQRLQDAGKRVGIITRNSHEGVAAVLCRHPLPYEVLITRDDLDNVKPHQEHLEQALAALGVAAAQALMVGDHATDIQCGQAAGVRTCGVLTARTALEQFHELGADFAFRDVPTLVAALLDEKLP